MILSEFELGYLAGMIDGEGAIGIVKQQRSDRVNPYLLAYLEVTQTDRQAIDYIRGLVMKLGLHPTFNTTIRPAPRSDRYDFFITRQDELASFLEIIKDRLRIKKRQAGVVQEFLKKRMANPGRSDYSEDEWKLYRDVRLLNERGKQRSGEAVL